MGLKLGSQDSKLLGEGVSVVFDAWSFMGGNAGAAAMYAVGRVRLKGAERVVRDQYEDRRRLTDAQRKAPGDALVGVTDLWTVMLEESADKLWEVPQNFRAQNGSWRH